MGILTVALPIILKLLGMYLDWSGANKESKENFLKMVDSLEGQHKMSVSLNKDYSDQLVRLRKKKSLVQSRTASKKKSVTKE